MTPSYTETIEAIKTGAFLAWGTKTQRLALETQNSAAETPIHWAAQTQGAWRGLSAIPQNLYTENNLLRLDKYQFTPLHYACERGQTDLLPAHLLTQTTLLKKGRNGITPLHFAAQYGHLHKLPPQSLTERAILTEDQRKSTPLHFAARHGELHLVPTSALTSQNLLRKDSYGTSPLQTADELNHLEQLHNRLPLSTLTELERNPQTPPRALPWIQKEAQKKRLLMQAIAKTQHADL